MDGKTGLRMGEECVHDSFDFAGQEGVVSIEQADHISRTAAIGGVEVSRHATVGIAQQPDAKSALYVRLHYLTRVVLGAIIADDDFRRWVGLLERAVDCSANVGSIVEAGDQYGDGGLAVKTLQCDEKKLVQSLTRDCSVLYRSFQCRPDHSPAPSVMVCTA